jgi:hypothetical protein
MNLVTSVRTPGRVIFSFYQLQTPWYFGLTGDMVFKLEELGTCVRSGAFPTILEKPRESFIFTPGRTHNRVRNESKIAREIVEKEPLGDREAAALRSREASQEESMHSWRLQGLHRLALS